MLRQSCTRSFRRMSSTSSRCCRASFPRSTIRCSRGSSAPTTSCSLLLARRGVHGHSASSLCGVRPGSCSRTSRTRDGCAWAGSIARRLRRKRPARGTTSTRSPPSASTGIGRRIRTRTIWETARPTLSSLSWKRHCRAICRGSFIRKRFLRRPPRAASTPLRPSRPRLMGRGASSRGGCTSRACLALSASPPAPMCTPSTRA
mmetsp:Transcript_54446/g.125457  ORF Transcript_54446/g.125457 Transcript_54446/m.125457 type:complete len:203 (-) Transcript_54446:768-1376(-)